MVWKLVAVGEGGEPPFSVTQDLLLQDLMPQMKGCQNHPLQGQQLSLLTASARHSHERQFETARTVPCSMPATSLQSLSPGSPRRGRTQESRSQQPDLGSAGPCCSQGNREEPRLGSTSGHLCLHCWVLPPGHPGWSLHSGASQDGAWPGCHTNAGVNAC